MKVHVKDYQIIKDVSAEFIPGLNIIIGPSNNGKTSLIKAIKALFYTEPGATPIRNGQSNYLVEIEHNNHKVTLKKGLKDSSYTVDGEVYSKYGTSTPEEVSKALGIKELILNGNKEQINFWNQMDYPFLLDKSSTDLFRFIVDSGDNDKVSQSLKSMVTDRKSLEQDIKTTQSNILLLDHQIDDLSTQVGAISPLIDSCNKIINLQSKVTKLRDLENTFSRLKSYRDNRNNLKEKYTNTITKINSLVPPLKEIIESYKKYIELLKFNLFFKEEEKDMTNLKSKLSSLEKLPKTQISSDNYFILVNSFNTITKCTDFINSAKIPKLPELDFESLKTSLLKLRGLEESNISISKIKDKTTSLENQILENESKTLEVDKILQHVTVCPVCGNSISIKEGKLC